MSDRRCPNCGELVPSNSLTCPSCYKEIPRDAVVYEIHEDDDGPSGRSGAGKDKNRTLTLILALLGVFGFMGLGQIYQGHHRKGSIFLVIGLPMMLILALLISGMGGLSAGWTILSLGLVILIGIPYVLLFIIQFLDAMASSAMRSVFSSFP